MNTPSKANPASSQAFEAFKTQHATALSDLRAYALDCQIDADRLNPIIHARTLEDMRAAAPNLNRYLACSVFIDELYHALIASAVQS